MNKIIKEKFNMMVFGSTEEFAYNTEITKIVLMEDNVNFFTWIQIKKFKIFVIKLMFQTLLKNNKAIK